MRSVEGPEVKDPQRRLALTQALSRIGMAEHEARALLGDRFELLARTIPQLIWSSRDLGRWTWASRQWEIFTGQRSADAEGLGWLECVHPDDRGITVEAWEGASEAGCLEVLHRICESSTAGYRWFETRAKPTLDAEGRTEWFGTCTDVHDLRTGAERERVLFEELQHRVRNLLASLRAMVRRGRDRPGSKSAFIDHLEGRLGAMSRVQVMATRDPFARIDLDALVGGELFAILAQEGRDLDMGGPAVTLSLTAAEIVVSALHELAVNALKFGALGKPGGELSIRWERSMSQDPPTVALRWSESRTDGKAAGRDGFGFDVLRRQLPYTLGADVDLRFGPTGLTCLMTFPVRPARDGIAPAFEWSPTD